MRILALDTATEACSCALLIDGAVLRRDTEVRKGHAELILTMVDELLRESALTLPMLDVIAFGRGPGSFTGVRLATSITQGLAFGAGLPVIGISDLRAVAQRMLGNNAAATRVLVCNDARMREVYWGCFEQDTGGLMQPVGPERVSTPGRVNLPQEWLSAGAVPIGPTHGAGRGFAAYPELRAGWSGRLATLDDTLSPSAAEIALLAKPELQAGRVLAPHEAIPVYLRDEVAIPSA